MSAYNSYDLNLKEGQFLNDYDTFRSATSQNFSYNGNDYPSVYLSSDDYAYINIYSNDSLAYLDCKPGVLLCVWL